MSISHFNFSGGSTEMSLNTQSVDSGILSNL